MKTAFPVMMGLALRVEPTKQNGKGSAQLQRPTDNEQPNMRPPVVTFKAAACYVSSTLERGLR
jgi:hypothetical protein